eukprot:sb/3466560/
MMDTAATPDFFEMVRASYPTQAPPDNPLRINIGETVLTILALLTGIVGLPIATLQGYFLFRVAKDQRTLSYSIYRAIWLTDFLVILWNIPVATAYVKGRQVQNTAFILTDGLGCTLWTIGWRSLVRTSVFNLAVLSITRTYSLVRPFSQPPRVRVVMATIVVYSVLVLVESTLPLWYGVTFQYYWEFVECKETVTNGTTLNNSYAVYQSAVLFIQLIVPMVVVSVSCGVTIATLWSNKVVTSSLSSDRIRNQATTTILGLTGIYIFFNTPFVLYWAVSMVNTYALPPNSETLAPFFNVFDGPTDGWFMYYHLANYSFNLSVSDPDIPGPELPEP